MKFSANDKICQPEIPKVQRDICFFVVQPAETYIFTDANQRKQQDLLHLKSHCWALYCLMMIEYQVVVTEFSQMFEGLVVSDILHLHSV